MNLRIASTTAVIALLTGCASVPPEAGFGDVQQQVEARTGHRVRWYQSDKEDAEVRAAMRKLLAKPLTAEAAVEIALLHNRDLQATYEDLGVSQAAVVQAGLLSNPVLDGNVKPAITGPGPEFEVTLAQNFLEIFYIPLRKAVAESEFEAAKLRVTGAVIDLATRTRIAFYRALANEQMIEMLRQVVAATGASHDAMRRLHDAGNVRDLDLHNERALFEQAKLDLAAAMAARDADREHLNTLMGLWGADTQWTVAPRLPELPTADPDFDGLEQKAVASSIDVAAARQDIESFGRRVGVTRATALVPDFDLGVAVKREAAGDWLLGPAFALPIPLFDQGQARIAGAQAELRRRQQAYIARAVQVRSAARAARDRVVAARRIAEHHRDVMVPLRTRLVRETQLEFNAMQVGVFQLMLAKQQQINAGQRYIDALHGYWTTRAELDAILAGRLPDSNGAAASAMVPSGSSGDTANQGGH